MHALRPTLTPDEANAYFERRLRADAWASASNVERSQALTQASYLLASAFTFHASAYEDAPDGSRVWHESVLAALCEEALWLLERNPTQFPELLALGVVHAEAAGLAATFDRAYVAPLVCDAAKRLIGRLADFEPVEDEGYSFASTPLAI